jgi:hypothetical protein
MTAVCLVGPRRWRGQLRAAPQRAHSMLTIEGVSGGLHGIE